jgi:hypothetical protein
MVASHARSEFVQLRASEVVVGAVAFRLDASHVGSDTNTRRVRRLPTCVGAKCELLRASSVMVVRGPLRNTSIRILSASGAVTAACMAACSNDGAPPFRVPARSKPWAETKPQCSIHPIPAAWALAGVLTACAEDAHA